MPTTVPAWFLTHPADFGCNESEGAGCSPTIDTTSTVPVLVLGPKVPSVGDLLPARMIGGKWVAERGNSGSGPPPPPFTTCCPCAIPQENLLLSWTGAVAGSTPLIWNPGTANWTASCVTLAGPIYITAILDCFVAAGLGRTRLRVTSYTGSGCTGTATTCSFSSDQTTAFWTCPPFKMGWNVTNTGCASLFALGFTSFTVTDANSTAVCQCDTVLKGRTIFVTDAANTAIPVAYTGTSQWNTGALQTGTVSPVTTGVGGLQVCSSSVIAGTTSYQYVINCINGPGAGQITLKFRRLFSTGCMCPAGPSCQYPVFGNFSTGCPAGSTGHCGTAGAGEGDGTAIISGVPFSGSISALTYLGTGGLPDPVGGGLTFSS
jgi:hypothetical protein